jgi:transaldolase/glucose-6-phosphate isomerase
MSGSRLAELLSQGQSVWLDFISRDLLRNGDLERMIAEDGLRGMTSNPSIFEKAVGGSSEYDAEIRALAGEGLGGRDIFDRLAIADVQAACDAFLPVYEASDGRDGFVSIEVAPEYAFDTDTTLAEARRLFAAVGRRNVMVKIPGTEEGLPAIRQALIEGVNINITLLFALDAYLKVAETYVEALEERVANGEPIGRIASVASFFVSRVDTLVDAWIEEKARGADGARKEEILALRGKLGVANSVIVYEHFGKLLAGDRWATLAAANARPQRVLWASTSTKNPDYDELLYVDNLIGPHTVNTLPEATYAAFKDHGTVARTVDGDVPGAHAHMDALAVAGIDVTAATDKLLADGVDLFVKSFNGVVGIVDRKRAELAVT